MPGFTNNASPAANSGVNPDFYYNAVRGGSIGDSVLGQSLHYHTATTNGGNDPTIVSNAYFPIHQCQRAGTTLLKNDVTIATVNAT